MAAGPAAARTPSLCGASTRWLRDAGFVTSDENSKRAVRTAIGRTRGRRKRWWRRKSRRRRRKSSGGDDGLTGVRYHESVHRERAERRKREESFEVRGRMIG